jgi:hypothetical protein
VTDSEMALNYFNNNYAKDDISSGVCEINNTIRRALKPHDFVTIPVGVDEARMMVLLGMKFLEENAPHLLKNVKVS